nr:hypothetical protein BgiMline_009903 [Biomphalaria glabrata]
MIEAFPPLSRRQNRYQQSPYHQEPGYTFFMETFQRYIDLKEKNIVRCMIAQYACVGRGSHLAHFAQSHFLQIIVLLIGFVESSISFLVLDVGASMRSSVMEQWQHLT